MRFVQIADWSWSLALDRATAGPEWLASLRRMFDASGLHITSEPAGCRVVVRFELV
ncbi:hypothetical protein GCM10010329_51080 [Streptomyces spiroverticillatus]|uniref:Uncharacterized protein n=1 Tax=Streptomyces finlayi TaxID=67296 RepID=A0A918X1M1_9ACTN|nr:hypothetical protein [Streptomyces finlayi]GHA21564.1 hypothetical protein GCM10010329_51080 [Streptomyces spiroverticillatus]GHD03891.1 hypothetical protein GCM10010334_52030 [Streptomyces finlayi]